MKKVYLIYAICTLLIFLPALILSNQLKVNYIFDFALCLTFLFIFF